MGVECMITVVNTFEEGEVKIKLIKIMDKVLDFKLSSFEEFIEEMNRGWKSRQRSK